jgi:large conductance mechanosensitive channel
MLKEFREFIMRGNVLDLAVAVILGVAFGAIITSLVDDIIMPLIGILLGGVDFTGLAIQVGNATLTYGNFIQAIINFLIVAFALFLIIKAANRVMRKKVEEPVPPAPTAEEMLLVEIRDLLKMQVGQNRMA